MPEYAGFTISLTSQYDAATIPEDNVRIVTTPTLRSLHLDNLTTGESPGLTQHPDKTFSDLHKQSSSTSTVIETYIPIYPSSQFWICYDCPPPDWDEEQEVKYYYFKLFFDGKCVLSWGVGEQDNWRGKTIFGLFDGGRDFEGKRIVEKRGLFFPDASVVDPGGFEIRVFRAKARRREPVRYQSVSEVVGGGGYPGSLDLTSIGKVHKGEKKGLYAYALLDARDEPWVVFRYRFESDEGDDTAGIESTLLSTELEDTTTSTSTEMPQREESPVEVTESSVWTGLEQNTPPQQSSMNESDAIAPTRRLSFPPRNRLLPTTSQVEPSSPIKQQTTASDDDLARPRTQSVQFTSIAMAEHHSVQRKTTGLRKPEWTAVRGASPAEQMSVGRGDEGDEGVWPVHRKTSSGSSGLLKSVVASALRRREERGK